MKCTININPNMKIIQLSQSPIVLDELLEMARQEIVILQKSDDE